MDDLYRQVIDNAPAMLFLGDAEGRGVFANQRWLDFTGWTLEQVAASDWYELVHPDDRQRVHDEFERGRPGPLDIECRLRRADGKYRWILASSRPRFDAHGRVVGYAGTCIDITARKEAETKLRESEMRHRLVMRSTYDAIWDWDLTTAQIDRSEAVETLFGYARAQIRDDLEWWSERVHPDDRARVRRSIDDTLKGGSSSWSAEYRFLRADSSYATVLDRGFIQRAPDGRPMRMTGAMMDVTEQRRTEETLAAQRLLLETILQHAVDAIAVYDVEGRLTFANAAARRLAGVDSNSTAAGTSVEAGGDAYDADGHLVPREEWARWKALRGEMTIGREARVHRADGGTYDLRISAAPMRDPSGQIVGAVVTFADITERKRAERRTAALLDITRVISGTIERAELLERVQGRTAALLPCDRVVIFHWEPTHDAFRAVSQCGIPEDLLEDTANLVFRPGVPMVDDIIAGNILVIDEHSDASNPVVALLFQFRLSAFAALPLRVHGRTVGCLVVHRNAGNPTFTADELELAEGIAHQLAVGLETVELLRAQRDEASVASALARVSQELISSLDAPVLLDRLCRIATEVLECDCAHSFLWDEADGAFVPIAGYGDPPEHWEALLTLKFPRRMMLGDERELWTGPFDDALGRLGTLARQMGLTSGLRISLRRGDDVAGILTAAHRQPNRDFSPRHQRIARGIGQLAVMALENARLVEALQRASRLKSDFVASMSHELRTPLNVIIGYNNLLLEGEFGGLSEAQIETARRMGRSADELLELINTTLDLGRLEAGRLPVNAGELRIAELIGEIDAETATIRRKNGVTFTWQVDPSLPALWSDRLKLKVILKNLIGNAMKFTAQGNVTVVIKHEGDQIAFTVKDTGIGISPEAQAVIFEPFRQAESSIGQNYGGVGLGLYIAKRLVALLGGSIAVTSAPEAGSVFHVTVPHRSPP